MREYLEKKLEGERDKKDAGGEETKVLKLAVGALMEVVQSRENNMEVAICRRDAPYQVLSVFVKADCWIKYLLV